jgi:hypothetical protein
MIRLLRQGSCLVACTVFGGVIMWAFMWYFDYVGQQGGGELHLGCNSYRLKGFFGLR